jgi:hypothetical protein
MNSQFLIITLKSDRYEGLRVFGTTTYAETRSPSTLSYSLQSSSIIRTTTKSLNGSGSHFLRCIDGPSFSPSALIGHRISGCECPVCELQGYRRKLRDTGKRISLCENACFNIETGQLHFRDG